MFFLNLSFKHSAKWKNSHIFGNRCNTEHIFWSNRQSMHIKLENWSWDIGIVHSKDCSLCTFYHIQDILKSVFCANVWLPIHLFVSCFLHWFGSFCPLSQSFCMFVTLPYWFLDNSFKNNSMMIPILCWFWSQNVKGYNMISTFWNFNLVTIYKLKIATMDFETNRTMVKVTNHQSTECFV